MFLSLSWVMGKESTDVLYNDQTKAVDAQVFSDYLIDKILELNDKFKVEGQSIELDCYYNTQTNTKNELLLVGDPVTMPQDEAILEGSKEAYMRIGTIGTTDLSMWPMMRLVDEELQVWEFDDGLGRKLHADVYKGLDKWAMKRKFIDSSFGIREDMIAFIKEYAVKFGWYDTLQQNLKTAVEKNAVINIDPLPKNPT